MSAFRDLVEAIQERSAELVIKSPQPAVIIASPFFVSTFEMVQRAHDERWDRRKLKRMMRRAGQGKRTA